MTETTAPATATPGPWRPVTIADVYTHVVDADSRPVATIYGKPADNAANAALIARAPAMRDALEAAADALYRQASARGGDRLAQEGFAAATRAREAARGLA